MKKIAIIIAALTIAGCGSNPLSGGAASLSAIPGAPGAGSSKSVDAGPLVKQLNESLFDLSRAQQHIFEAFGLKQEAEQAASNSKVFETGNSVNAEVIEKTGAANAKVAELILKNDKLSKEGKKKMTQALPHFAKGLIHSAGLGMQLTQAATSISANPMSVVAGPYKTTDLITVFTSSPKLLTEIVDTGHKFITYSSNNGIDTKEVESSLKDIK